MYGFNLIIALILTLFIWQKMDAQDIHFRINQMGYLTEEPKSAILFSEKAIAGKVFIKGAKSEKHLNALNLLPIKADKIGAFSYFYEVDFSHVQKKGSYVLSTQEGKSKSRPFDIGDNVYKNSADILLEFMRQQRCGYNPFLDMECHQMDGRSMYGPIPDSSFIDVSGGWHDAGDQLKYLITGSYATAHMLKSFEMYPDVFADKFNALGQEGSNGIEDVLDEAKWGLDWIHKLHVDRNSLVHQIADDRDHIGYKMPDQDISDYGWGPNSYRVAYFANGKPQGLNKYKSRATGYANLAGRSAAGMAIASRIWSNHLNDTSFSDQCLNDAISLYQLGKENEGFQQGNSYGAPYRYGEITWADDMEWAAAELFKSTGDSTFLADAIRYAKIIGSTSWMNKDTAAHYVYYPFVNMGHHALYPNVNKDFQDTLAKYYRNGIDYTHKKSQESPFEIGIPFIWCSNNLLTSLITQIILYEDMTGNKDFHDYLLVQRDWLFGRNPWGTSMFTGMPEDGEYPEDIHTSIYVLTKKMVRGGLVDGPVFTNIYNALLGLTLINEDEFSAFQSDKVVYHDDYGDYSTNEPTMDGTAGSILLMAYWASKGRKK